MLLIEAGDGAQMGEELSLDLLETSSALTDIFDFFVFILSELSSLRDCVCCCRHFALRFLNHT